MRNNALILSVIVLVLNSVATGLFATDPDLMESCRWTGSFWMEYVNPPAGTMR